jgi:hypothetical protein
MNDFEGAGRKLFLVEKRRGQQAVALIRRTDRWPDADFPMEITKVAVINVDTAGKDAPLSSQEGI